MKNRLEKSEDNPTTRMILRKTLHSYERRLEEARDILTSTPPSSDDEDAEEFHVDTEKAVEEFFAPTRSKPQVFFYDAIVVKPSKSSKLEGLHGKLSELNTVAEEMYKNPTLKEKNLTKVDDTINFVETPKNYKKTKKANKLANEDGKASYSSTRKNSKNLKNLKDEYDAEPGRKH